MGAADPDNVLTEVIIKLAPTFLEENFAIGFKVTLIPSPDTTPDKLPEITVALSVASYTLSCTVNPVMVITFLATVKVPATKVIL